MTRVVRPGGRVVVLEITTPTAAAAVDLPASCGLIASSPASGKLAGDPDAYTYLPSSVRRFPAPEALAAIMWGVGLRDMRYVLTAGGIIALHVGEVPGSRVSARRPGQTATGRAGGHRGRGRARRAADGALESRMGELAARPRRAAGHATPRDTLAAGGKRLRPLLVFLAAGAPPPETEGLLRAAVAVELVHRRPWSTTTCSTAPICAAGGPPWSPPAGAGWPPPPATCCSRAPSPSWPRRAVGAGGARPVAGQLRAGRGRADAARRRLAGGRRERYLERCRLKTGVLFRAACELGALEGERAGARRLGAFGERIGIAFQLLDDVLDVSGPAGAHRQAARHRPARRHRHAAAAGRPRARSAELARAGSARVSGRRRRRPRSATGSPPPVRWTTARAQALEMVGRGQGRAARARSPPAQALELVADGVVERYA